MELVNCIGVLGFDLAMVGLTICFGGSSTGIS